MNTLNAAITASEHFEQLLHYQYHYINNDIKNTLRYFKGKK